MIFRGYSAQLISVDEGLDVIAYRDAKFYFFQVKYGIYNKELALERIEITKSSFENNINSSVYYMFILARDDKKDFLIVPVFVLEKIIDKNGKKIGCTIFHNKKDVFINKISSENKVTKYLNKAGWRILQYS